MTDEEVYVTTVESEEKGKEYREGGGEMARKRKMTKVKGLSAFFPFETGNITEGDEKAEGKGEQGNKAEEVVKHD